MCQSVIRLHCWMNASLQISLKYHRNIDTYHFVYHIALSNECLITHSYRYWTLSTCWYFLRLIFWWMTYYTHHMLMDTHSCVYIDVLPGHSGNGMPYYTCQKHMDAQNYMCFCLTRLLCSLNALLHTSHAYGHSLLCKCSCITRTLQ